MAITYYGLWLIDLLFKFNYCLLFALFYLNFYIIFGRILGLNQTRKTRVFHRTQTRIYGFEKWRPGFRVPGLHSLAETKRLRRDRHRTERSLKDESKANTLRLILHTQDRLVS